jgi:hypothetical protein
MVAMMSPMRPVRLAVRAASRAASPLRPSRSASLRDLGRGGAPVDQQRFAVVVEQAHPPDVEVGAVGPVEAAEAQAVLGRGQLGQAAAVTGHEGIPVDPGLDVAAALVAERPLQLGLGPLAQGVQAPIEHRHVCLFLFQLSGEILHP